MNLAEVKKLNIPKKPGSYQFFNKKGKIIYIGKAANLKSRVLSYWQKSATHSPAKYAMTKQVEKIKWLETESEIEALLLEANLIKKFQPDFNVLMRDDKRYAYIKVSVEEDWPRVYLTRKLDKAGKFFGPFTSASATKETLRAIHKLWPLRTCRTMPKKACLYYRIGKCLGMCEFMVDKKEYNNYIKQIVLFLEGKKKAVVKEIKKQIKDCEKRLKKYQSADKKYQELNNKVNYLKYQLINFNKVLEHANIISLADKYAADVIELAKVLSLPKVPERIEGYDISNLPMPAKAGRQAGIFGRQSAVGSMVVFENGEPNKSQYRKFKIKIGQGQASDVRMLREVLERRFKRSPKIAKDRQRSPDKQREEILVSWSLPDLIIVDGGKPQLNVAVRILKSYKLGIPVIAISKGLGLRTALAPDKIFFPGEKRPLELQLASPALHIIKRVRDEAHRFAISYHRLLRKKKLRSF